MDNKKIIAHLTVSVIGGVAGSLLVEALKEHTEKRANERLQEIMAYAKLSTLRADTEAKMEALEEKEKMYREHIRNMTKNRSKEHSKMEREKARIKQMREDVDDYVSGAMLGESLSISESVKKYIKAASEDTVQKALQAVQAWWEGVPTSQKEKAFYENLLKRGLIETGPPKETAQEIFDRWFPNAKKKEDNKSV